MAAATILFFLGTNIWVLVVARALQGASAAFVWTAGIAYLSSVLGAEHSGAAMGWVSFATSGGEVLGPVVGGVVYGYAGHFAVFAVSMALVFLDIVLRLWVRENAATAPEATSVEDQENQPLLEGSNHVTGEEISFVNGIHSQHELPAQATFDRPSSPLSKPKNYDHQSSQDRSGWRRYALLRLMLDPDCLASLWSNLFAAIMRTALETVSAIYNDRFSWQILILRDRLSH